MHDITHIPLSQINPDALTRDRSVIITQELEALKQSLLTSGLRQPVEVFDMADDGYALISGYRRLIAVQQLFQETADVRWAKIPAFIRQPMTGLPALALVVEENEMRSQVSPWERGRIIHVAVEQGLAANLDDAQLALFPQAGRMARYRLRVIARAVQVMDEAFQAAEEWSERQCMRLAQAVDAGFAPHMEAALNDVAEVSGPAEWAAVEPYVTEAETIPIDQKPIGNRPRRLANPQPGLTVRREKVRNGYALIIAGERANAALAERVFDDIELWLNPG